MTSTEKINNVCLLIIAATCLTVGLIYTKSILIPFVLAFFLYSSVNPLVNYLENRFKFPRILAVLSNLLVGMGLIALLYFLGSLSLKRFLVSSEAYKARFASALNDLATTLQTRFGFEIETLQILDEWKNLPFLDLVKSLSGGVFGIAGNTVLVTLIFMFLILGSSKKPKSSLVQEAQLKISKYIITKVLASAITAFLVGLLLVIFKVDMAFLFALLTFVLNFIPNVGSMVATLLPLPVIFIQYGLGGTLVAVVSISFCIQFLIGNVLEPKLMGDSVGLHPLTILLFLMFWGLVWGIPGMFLAVPITATLKIVLSRIPTTQNLARAM